MACFHPRCTNNVTSDVLFFDTNHLDANFKGTKEEKEARHTATETRPTCDEHQAEAFTTGLGRKDILCVHAVGREKSTIATP